MRRLTTTVLGLAALALSAVPATAGTDEPADAIRPTGKDRYETAAMLAGQAFEGDTADTVVVASGEKFPDGLAASYLTGVLDAPILLVRPDLPIPQATLDAIDAVNATKVIIAGGPSSVSEAVEDKLKEELGEDNVERIHGKTRVETATLLATAGDGDVGTMPDLSGDTEDELRTAIVAHEGNFPDALSVGALANAGKYPLLLTETDDLNTLTEFTLEDDTLGIEQVIIAGGPSSVSAGVEAQIADLDNIRTVHRVSGATRSDTAAEIAGLAQAQLGWDGTVTALTTGENFPDALALAPLAARNQASILLTPSTETIGGATFGALQAVCENATTIVVASGERWIPDAVAAQAEAASECADIAIDLTPEAAGGEGDAAGTAWFWYDTFCYAYRVTGVTPPLTAAHIHEIQEDGEVDGPPVADLAVGSFVMDCVTDEDVTDNSSANTADELVQQIQDDPASFYVNVHSQEYPDGVVRGSFA